MPATISTSQNCTIKKNNTAATKNQTRKVKNVITFILPKAREFYSS